MGLSWSDVKDWKASYLESQVERLRAERAKWLQGATDAEAAMNKVASSGAGVEAIRASLRRKLAAINACANKLSELMMATSQACDGVWSVETKILECEQYAEINKLRIYRDGRVEALPRGHVTSIPVSGVSGQPSTAVLKNVKGAEELKKMIAEVLTYAKAVDQRYKMRMWAVATGTYASQETHKSTSPGLYNFPRPEWSATEVATWWNTLSAAEKQNLITNHPEMIGNLNGVDMASRDQANRILLPRKISQAEARIRTLRAALKASEKYEDFSRDRGSRSKDDIENELKWEEKRLADLKAIRSTLEENDKLRKSEPDTPKRGLVYMDDSKKDDRVKVAISTGDVDHAKHVSIILPGMDNVPSEDIKDHVKNAELVRRHAADNAGIGKNEVATIAWVYDTPQGTQVASTKYATNASHEIKSALEGIHASRQASGAGRAHMSLLGHSYGSTTAGKVAKLVRKGVLDDLAMYGSPGSGVQDARDYNLDRGRAYVSGVNTNDVIQGIGPDGTYGKNPMKMEGIKHLANNPDKDSVIKIGTGAYGIKYPYAAKGSLNPIARHSEYLEEGTESLEDISRVVTNVPVKGEK